MDLELVGSIWISVGGLLGASSLVMTLTTSLGFPCPREFSASTRKLYVVTGFRLRTTTDRSLGELRADITSGVHCSESFLYWMT
uniref:Putative secreted protein n=1 Tax=Ixodes ricinus TaxID=34613 RepID=A0A6B0U6V6_IXORI